MPNGLRNARLKANMSVSEVMKALNVSDGAVYQWETGVTFPRRDKLMKLATLYGCTIDELYAGGGVADGQ